MLSALGYDPTDPYEVYPEYVASFDSSANNKVDLAVLRDGQPIIAIECKKAGTGLARERGQLRGYFNALQTVKLGVLTDGIVWEFFVDSTEPNIMDDEPFLTFDLETIINGSASDELLEALASLTRPEFEPDGIAETAHVLLVKKRLRTALAEELSSPSEDFCRVALQKAGLKYVRRSSIERYYGPMVKDALADTLAHAVATRAIDGISEDSAIDRRILTTDRELAVYGYVRRRLAYLVDEEVYFSAIEQVQYKDYIGKLVVFFERERKGWLFDYVEGADGYDKFLFPEPYGTIMTNNIADIDKPLKAIFTGLVRDRGGIRREFARIA
jgi:predicted type IV restriction endonuclease